MKKTTSTILAAAVSGLLVGAMTGCTSEEKPNDSGGTSPTSPGGEQPPAGAVIEKHACKGMNSCSNKGVSGKNECAGKGDCATVAHHDCGGKNECSGQGGCKTAKHDCAGKNDCAGQGGCGVPVKMTKK